MERQYALVCMAIVYHVGQGRDMRKEAQTATGLALMNDTDGLRCLMERLEKLGEEV